MDAIVTPERSLEVLSRLEVDQLHQVGTGGPSELLRRCSLAVLNTVGATDDARQIFETFSDFGIEVVQVERGIRLKVTNAPEHAFVDGKMIRGHREHLFSVLRDVRFMHTELGGEGRFDIDSRAGITNFVFHMLRQAGVLRGDQEPRIVVCWGGHSIARPEYEYTKLVGYELGLRGLDVCTGCGPGAMKGPMKGAAIGHAKQRIRDGRYLGLTEPGIIAAESPNAIVNELVILPDIEKRLEAFVRTGHGIVVFPGGAGTAEEILYLLGILLHPDNKDLPFPVVFTGPASSAAYFEQIDRFVKETLGEAASDRYEIVIDDPVQVSRLMHDGIESVQHHRRSINDAYYFNWSLAIDVEFQRPFEPTHDAMRALDLSDRQPAHVRAANLRRAFSGIVSGNVKDEGIKRVETHGPFEICGGPDVVGPLGELLEAFVAQRRMKLPVTEYVPCYRVVDA